MTPRNNPILRRLVQERDDAPVSRFWGVLIGLVAGTLTVFISFSLMEWPADTFTIVPYLACPAAAIMLMLLSAVTATATVREVTGEPFELLFLTNISRAKVVLGLFGGLVYRLRTYLVLASWLMVVTTMPLIIAGRMRPDYYFLEQAPIPLGQMFILLGFVVTSAMGLALLTVTVALSSGLRLRRPLYASVYTIVILSILSSFGFTLAIGILTDVEEFDALKLALPLFALPYLVGLSLSLHWQTPWIYVISASIFPLGLIVLLIIVEFAVSLWWHGDGSLELFLGLNVLVAAISLFRLRQNWRGRLAPAIASHLVWQLLVIGLLAPNVLNSNTDFWDDVLIFLLTCVWIVAPFGVAASTLIQAERWVWRWRE